MGCCARNERARDIIAGSQFVSQLDARKSVGAACPPDGFPREATPKKARAPTARTEKAQENNTQRGAGSSARYIARRNTGDQATRRGIKGDPRGASHHALTPRAAKRVISATFGAPIGPAKRGRAAGVYTPRCRYGVGNGVVMGW